MELTEITADQPMGFLIDSLPGARRSIFARYHLGGCQSCAFSNDESLQQLCERSGIDVGEMIDHLKTSHVDDLAMLKSPTEIADHLSDWRLIDLRTREEHEAVKIPNSGFFTQDLQQTVFAGSHDAQILLYDHCGGNVLDQVAWFRGHGLQRTFGLLGGIDAWSQQIDPKIGRYRVEIER